MAECVTHADGSMLPRENHCPICIAAKSCQGLCREELGLFRAVLRTDLRRAHGSHSRRRFALRLRDHPTD
jgi:predicted ArsR family transcriptional regulator